MSFRVAAEVKLQETGSSEAKAPECSASEAELQVTRSSEDANYDQDGPIQHLVKRKFRYSRTTGGKVFTFCQCIFCDTQLSIMGAGNFSVWALDNWGVCKTCHKANKIYQILPNEKQAECLWFNSSKPSEISKKMVEVGRQFESLCPCDCESCQKIGKHKYDQCWEMK